MVDYAGSDVLENQNIRSGGSTHKDPFLNEVLRKIGIQKIRRFFCRNSKGNLTKVPVTHRILPGLHFPQFIWAPIVTALPPYQQC